MKTHLWIGGGPACWRVVNASWWGAKKRRQQRALVVSTREDETTCLRCVAWMKRRDW